MYTRTGCCLCDQAWDLLTQEQKRWGFQLEAVDVDQAEDLRSAHGERVPVVEVAGKVRFWGRLNPVMVRRLFEAQARLKS